MPLELGPISVVGKIIDFSIPGASRESIMSGRMHEDNVVAMDFEIDQGIKGAGRLNVPMDISTSSKTITIEKNILVTLYVALESEAEQSFAGTSQAEFEKWWSEAPYGDDPVDQVWIKAGIDYAKSKGY